MKPEFTCSSSKSSMVCVLASLGTLLLGTVLPAAADDTSVYAAQLASQQKPNILFVLDYSGSMQYSVDGQLLPEGDENARIAILKRAVNTLLEDNSSRINAGLGALFSSNAGGVRWPISDPEADASGIDPDIPANLFTSRQIIEKQMNRLRARHNTATVNALVDAALYFKGGRVAHDDRPVNQPGLHMPDRWDTDTDSYRFGAVNAALPASYLPRDAYQVNANVPGQIGYCQDYSPGGGDNFCAGRATYDCVALDARGNTAEGNRPPNQGDGRFNSCKYEHPDRWTTPNYVSPITQMCQANYIVLISDGEPTSRHVGQAFDEVLEVDVNQCEDLSSSIFGAAAGTRTQGNCGPEIVAELARTDRPLIAGIPSSKVTTYTIGFSVEGPGQNYLKKLAEASGEDGRFFEAQNTEQLTQALEDALLNILGGSENFAELAVDVNRATFASDDRAYLNLFSPTVNRSWPGNLKGFFLKPEGLVDTNGVAAIVQTGADAGGSESSYFSDEMQSFWSPTADGNEVVKGGGNASVTSGNRDLYTYTGTLIPDNGVTLDQDAHKLISSNNAVSAALLGLPNGSAARTPLLEWLATAPMGDPLHSKPVRVEYKTTDGTATTSRQVVYTMTNQGFLHAFDATLPASGSTGDHSGGEELFAFMPPGLLRNLPAIKESARGGNHIYGLDGSITRWHDDSNGNGLVDGIEKVMLVMGMRRGGGSYHAVDVTNPESPKYLWRIDAGSTGFEDLAQTWSRASLITVKRGTGTERVLAFGGGYDAMVLDGTDQPTASKGNAIYFVDRDGDKIWSTSGSTETAMQYAIPSDLTPIDSDADGLADRLYVGDTGGQVWRIDFDDVNVDSNFEVSRLANLHDGKHQPFFYPPSVAFNRSTAGDYLSVSIGSGNRTQPLLPGSENSLFVLRDTDLPKGKPANLSLIEHDDLFDTTDNAIASSDAATAARAAATLASKRGWQVKLGRGEKALSQVVSFEGRLLATTYEADTGNGNDMCTFESTRRIYRMDLEDGRPLSNGGQADLTSAMRAETIDGRGIPSAPVVVFPPGSSMVQILVDKQLVNSFDQQLSRVYWHAK